MNLLLALEHQKKPVWVLAGFALVGVIGLLDYISGVELVFSLFYYLPIAMITWIAGRRLGILVSLTSSLVLLVAELLVGQTSTHPLVFIWNTVIRLGSFIVLVYLLSFLRKSLDAERQMARSDYLTGAVNSRYFYDLLQMEIVRSQRYRHPFTVAYIDLDDFKLINDRYGHKIGDEALRTVVVHLKNQLRKSDVVARVGGDEFVVLLPETDQQAAQHMLSKIQTCVMESVKTGNLPISFSVGVLTYEDIPDSVDEIISLADELMYSVKRNGKHAVKYATYDG